MSFWQRRILHLQFFSLIPVSVAALFNVGYQYLSALGNHQQIVLNDFRSQLAHFLGAGAETPGIYDFFIVGFAHLGPTLALALFTGGLWERIIAEQRNRAFELGFIPIAVIFTLFLPAATSLSHVVFGMSFAILVGKGIFGGDGKTFLSPALLGIAIVQVSFPGMNNEHPLWNGLSGYSGSDAIALYYRGGEAALAAVDINLWSAFLGYIPGPVGTTSIVAVLLGATVLLWTRLISWRLLVAQLLGLVLCALLFGLLNSDSSGFSLPPVWHLLIGSFAFGAVYLACDPVSSCCTNPGRWIQGLLIGVLVVVIRELNPTHPDAVIPVILLASILAPLIDHIVVFWNIRQRSRRHV